MTRRTPGRFSTRVVTRGVEPTLKISYEHSSLRQHFKAERALRTETTVNDARGFGLGRRLSNLAALRQLGFACNRRLLDLQRAAQRCPPPQEILEQIVLPSRPDGLPGPGLRFGDPRVMALSRSLCHHQHLLAGLSNRTLRPLAASQLGRPYSASQISYDLRRLRRKGLIERVPRTHRSTLTQLGRQVALFFSKLHVRVIRPALRELDPRLPADNPDTRSLAHPWRRLDQALDTLIARAQLAPEHDPNEQLTSPQAG